MALSYTKFKSIDVITKQIVCGYLRQTTTTNSYTLVTDLIVATCTLFYYVGEQFAVSDDEKTEPLILSEYRDIVTLCTHGKRRYSIYGRTAIDNQLDMVYVWAFNVVSFSNEALKDIWIGIDGSLNTAHDAPICNDFRNGKGPYYCFSSSGRKYFSGYWGRPNGYVHAQGFGAGDVVKMELNTKQKTLRFLVNDRDRGIVFDRIKFRGSERKFYLLVSICSEDDLIVSLQIATLWQMRCT